MNNGKKVAPLFLVLSMALSGCGEKSDCNIPSRHLHQYTHETKNGAVLQKYMESERLKKDGYNWNENYYEINQKDAELYRFINKEDLLSAEDNWDYLYNLMSENRDYLEFYYRYTTTETRIVTDDDGDSHLETYEEVHDGWTRNPNDPTNTGVFRVNHYQYRGYQIVDNGKKYKKIHSEYVDDIRDVLSDYPYFKLRDEKVIYNQHATWPWKLDDLNVDDFDDFKQPDLSNKEITPSRKTK